MTDQVIFYDENNIGWNDVSQNNLKWLEKTSRDFRSPVVEPGEFLAVENIYESMGLGHSSDQVKSEFLFIGWYVNEKGETIFGNRDDFISCDHNKCKIMHDARNYICKMREITQQWPI